MDSILTGDRRRTCRSWTPVRGKLAARTATGLGAASVRGITRLFRERREFFFYAYDWFWGHVSTTGPGGSEASDPPGDAQHDPFLFLSFLPPALHSTSPPDSSSANWAGSGVGIRRRPKTELVRPTTTDASTRPHLGQLFARRRPRVLDPPANWRRRPSVRRRRCSGDAGEAGRLRKRGLVDTRSRMAATWQRGQGRSSTGEAVVGSGTRGMGEREKISFAGREVDRLQKEMESFPFSVS